MFYLPKSITSPLLLALGLLGLLCTASTPLHAIDLQEAIADKAEGRHDLAIEKLEEYRVDHPENPQAIFHLATLYGWTERNQDALALFALGHELYPEDSDMTLGYARVLAWTGDLQSAEKLTLGVLESEPAQIDARILLGRILSWQRRYHSAEAAYRDALEQHPEHPDALEGLGDIAAWQDQFAEAREYYSRALAVDPQSVPLQTKLDRIQDIGPWRMDAGVRFGHYSRGDRPDSFGTYLSLRYAVNRKTGVFGKIEWDRKFDLNDWSYEIGADHRLSDYTSLAAAVSWTPKTAFSPKWQARAHLDQRLHNHPTRQSFLLLDARHRHYPDGDARSFGVGIRQHLSQPFWLTVYWNPVNNLNRQWSHGWSLRADWRVQDNWQLYAGHARGNESIDGNVIDLRRNLRTNTWFAGWIWDINPVRSMRIDFVQEEIVGSVIHRVWHVGFVWKF